MRSISASVGTFKVPVGIDFKGAAAGSLRPSTGGKATQVVLIDTTGTVARVAPATATNDELRAWISELS